LVEKIVNFLISPVFQVPLRVLPFKFSKGVCDQRETRIWRYQAEKVSIRYKSVTDTGRRLNCVM